MFVRDLRYDKSQKLNRWLRNSRNGIQMRRVHKLLAARQLDIEVSMAARTALRSVW